MEALADALAEALARARWLAAAGLGPGPEPALLDAHAELFAPAALRAARDAWQQTSPDDPLAVARRRLALEWRVDLAVEHATLALDAEQRAWERAAELPLPDGTTIPLGAALHDVARSRDRDRRLALADLAVRHAAAALAPLAAERLQREWAVLDALALGDPAAARLQLAGTDLAAVRAAAEGLLAATAPLYAEGLAWLARRRLGLPADRLARADLGVLLDTPEPALPAAGGWLVELARASFGELGIDATLGGRIRIDADARAGKRLRASCVAVRIPEEIHVVLSPSGSLADLPALWHELGHALHLASVDATRPVEERRLVDRATAEAMAQLVGRIPGDPRWLRRTLRLPRAEAEALARERAVVDLFLLRRYAARLLAEVESWAEASVAALPERYAERLSAALLVRYRPEEALLDLDPGLGSAAYVRGGLLAATLYETCLERWDEDWFRNPAAGPPLRILLASDRALAPAAIAAAWTGRTTTDDADTAADAAAVVRLAERVLG